MTYYPQPNAILEHWHRKMKAAIKPRDDPFWSQALPFILLGVRTVAREEFAFSSSDMLFGENLRFCVNLNLDERDCLGETGLLCLLREAVS